MRREEKEEKTARLTFSGAGDCRRAQSSEARAGAGLMPQSRAPRPEGPAAAPACVAGPPDSFDADELLKENYLELSLACVDAIDASDSQQRYAVLRVADPTSIRLRDRREFVGRFIPIPLPGPDADAVQSAFTAIPFKRTPLSFATASAALLRASDVFSALPGGFQPSTRLVYTGLLAPSWSPPQLWVEGLSAAGYDVSRCFVETERRGTASATVRGALQLVPSPGRRASGGTMTVPCKPGVALAISAELRLPVLVHRSVWEDTAVPLEQTLDGLRFPPDLRWKDEAEESPREPPKSAANDPFYVKAAEERERRIAELVAEERYEEAAAERDRPMLDRERVLADLEAAVREERYEDAARLRDELVWLTDCKADPDNQGNYDPYLDRDPWYRPVR
eukprot:tig00020538_g10336.t1